MAAGDEKKMANKNPALQQPPLREIHRHPEGGFSLLKLTMTLAVRMILAAIAATSLPFPDRDRAFRRFRTAFSLLAARAPAADSKKKRPKGRYYKSQDFKYEKKNAGALR